METRCRPCFGNLLQCESRQPTGSPCDVIISALQNITWLILTGLVRSRIISPRKGSSWFWECCEVRLCLTSGTLLSLVPRLTSASITDPGHTQLVVWDFSRVVCVYGNSELRYNVHGYSELRYNIQPSLALLFFCLNSTCAKLTAWFGPLDISTSVDKRRRKCGSFQYPEEWH